MKMAFSDLLSTKSRVHNHCTTSTFVKTWFRNTTAQPPLDHHDSENDFIWSSQHWNRCLQASKNLYRCENWTLRHSSLWKTPVEPPRQLKWLYLIFSALKQQSTSITQPLHLATLNFSTFLVPKYDYTTSTGQTQKWKRIFLIFPALKQESRSIGQHLQLWKLGFRTFHGTETHLYNIHNDLQDS